MSDPGPLIAPGSRPLIAPGPGPLITPGPGPLIAPVPGLLITPVVPGPLRMRPAPVQDLWGCARRRSRTSADAPGAGPGPLGMRPAPIQDLCRCVRRRSRTSEDAAGAGLRLGLPWRPSQADEADGGGRRREWQRFGVAMRHAMRHLIRLRRSRLLRRPATSNRIMDEWIEQDGIINWYMKLLSFVSHIYEI